MEKLHVFICENYYPEYQAALRKEEIDDVELHVYPTLCDQKGRKNEVKEMLSQADTGKSILICNRSCDAIKLIDGDKPVETVTSNYCFTHLICDEFLDFLTSQGSYIVSLGWLKQWKYHLTVMGFDNETARSFFQETSKQIVFLDAKIDDQAEGLLVELSSTLGLPYLIVPVKLETIQLLLKSKICEWRLHHQNIENTRVINELRSQSADYAAVFDMLGRISSHIDKRDIIGKVKDLFMMVFGAQNFRFWNEHSELMPIELREFQSNHDDYTMLKNENRFCIKVSWDGYLYGILDASGFIFPQYIDRYLNLALDITKFLGLVLNNNEQYKKIAKSEKELKHISFHDTMTGLFNRNYINQLLTDEVKEKKTIVFMFDIDKLKHVNDNFGHAAGDKLISSFADVIRKCFREVDIVARIGGDEFTAVVYDGDEKTAITIKQRILDFIKMNNENLNEKHLELSVSIGYAMRTRDNETIEDIMKKADVLMYEDKMEKRQSESMALAVDTASKTNQDLV